MNDKLLGQLRHSLTLFAGYVIGKGWIPSNVAGEIITWVCIAAPFVWSWLAKKAPAVVAAIEAEVDSGSNAGTTK